MAEHYFLSVLGAFIDLASIYLYFFIFMKKRKKNIPFGVVAVSFVLVECAVFFVSEITSANFSVAAISIRILTSLVTIFLLTLFYEVSFKHRLFFTLSLQAIMMVAELISQFIVQYQMKLSEETVSSMSDAISFITPPISFFIMIFVSIILRNHKLYSSIRFSSLLLVAPLLTICIAFNRTILLSSEGNQSSFAFMITGFLIINYMNYFLLTQSMKSFEEKEKLHLIKRQTDYQQEKYAQLSSAYRKLRAYQHDTKKRFQYIRDCVNKENFDAILPFLDESLNDLNSSYSRVNTGNLAIDSFVSNFILLTEDKGIDFEYDLRIEAAKVPVSDYDLSIILGNLLDNALNACNEADSDKKRFIKLNVCTSLEKGQFIIRTINTNPVKDLKKNEDLSHGYGLVNIKEHLDKVFGIMDLKENEKEFEVCVIIPLMQIENKASNS